MNRPLMAAVALGALASTAQADCMRALSVSFTESAPRDRFDIVHTATGVVLDGVRIDLAKSAGKLIFDTENGGAGVEVFQPFESTDGLTAQSVSDGADVVDVRVGGLESGSRTAFTIDVDDRMAQSDLGQIRVTGGEMRGAEVVFSLSDGETLTAVFDDKNRAKVCS